MTKKKNRQGGRGPANPDEYQDMIDHGRKPQIENPRVYALGGVKSTEPLMPGDEEEERIFPEEPK